MRTVEINRYDNGTIIITLEYPILFGIFKYKKRYIATKKYLYGFWNWKKLPKMTRVKPIDAINFNLICQQQEERKTTDVIYVKDIYKLISDLHGLMWMTKSKKVKDAYSYSINELHDIINNNGL